MKTDKSTWPFIHLFSLFLLWLFTGVRRFHRIQNIYMSIYLLLMSLLSLQPEMKVGLRSEYLENSGPRISVLKIFSIWIQLQSEFKLMRRFHQMHHHLEWYIFQQLFRWHYRYRSLPLSKLEFIFGQLIKNGFALLVTIFQTASFVTKMVTL